MNPNDQESNEKQTSNQEQESITPEKGKKDLTEAFNAWTAGLAIYSVQATYAIIAANWAVHSRQFLSNRYAMWSIGVCVGFIMVNILLVWVITEFHGYRMNKAYSDKSWWLKEYNKRALTKWPYSRKIEYTSFVLRIIKGLAPIAAGILFILSLLCGGQ